jgi:1,4-dihydroxy-2-naphthoyl-CoA hydrolase
MVYERVVRLADTDAAGVIYFASGLSICHEAYESALFAQGIDLSQLLQDGAIALPIVHAAIDFLRPVRWGDRLGITLSAQLLSDHRFVVDYVVSKIAASAQRVITAQTIHVSFHPQLRQKVPLPLPLKQAVLSLNNRNL